jgi:Rrf2 family protein
MLLSQTAQYALRAVYYLVSDGDDKWHLTKDVAEITKIPAPYLARIMSTLAKRGILQSRTGMGGGFKIGKEGLKNNLYDIVSQFDNLENITDCIFGFDTCCEGKYCILHESWFNLKNQLIEMLKLSTLQDISNSDVKVDWSRVES